MIQPERPRPAWHLTRSDQAVLYLLGLAVLVLAAYRHASAFWSQGAEVRKLEPGARIAYRVDLNRADAAELDLLPGIGPAKARRIIEHRAAHGPFKRLADLSNVRGIGPVTVGKLRAHLRFDVSTSASKESSP